MSMDIILRVACSISIPSDLPQADSWKNYGGPDWAYETDSWQVIVEPLSDSSIPPEVKSLDSNIAKSFVAVLEPLGAGEEGYAFLNSVTVSVAQKCGGAVLEGPRGLVKLDAQGAEI